MTIASFQNTKSVASLYASNEWLELKIKNTTPFTLAPKKKKKICYKPSKVCIKSIWGELQNTDDRNQRTKCTEEYSLFIDRKTQ